MNKYVIFFVGFVFLVGCRSSKNIGESRIKSLSEAKIVSSVLDSQLDFNNLYIKKFDGVVNFDGNQFSFKGAMYIQRDSQIVISVMPLMGIELFKAMITPTQVVLIDKTKKKVYEGNINYLSKKFNVDIGYKALESILTNRISGIGCVDDDLDCYKKFNFQTKKEGYLLTSLSDRRQKNSLLQFVQILVDAEFFHLNKLFIKHTGTNSELNVDYSNFINYGSCVFPKSIKIEGKSGEKNIKFSMEISSVEKDVINGLTFKVPEKYEKVSIN